MSGPDERRRFIDLRRLPVGWQYVIALTTVAVVVGLAVRFGEHRPAPRWLSDWLIPALGWVVLVVFGFRLARWLMRRLGRSGSRPRGR
jgi:hypothetical protein